MLLSYGPIYCEIANKAGCAIGLGFFENDKLLAHEHSASYSLKKTSLIAKMFNLKLYKLQ